MNIGQLKEYIKDLPDDMEIFVQIDGEECNVYPGINGNKLIL